MTLCIMDLRLHHDASALESTNYFEFLPRGYEKTLWNDDSVYLYHEVVHLFDDLLAQHVPNYSHFSFSEATGAQAHRFAEDLTRFADQIERVSTACQCGIPHYHAEKMEHNWPSYRKELASSLRELAQWIKRQVPEEGILSVLGM